MCVIIIKPAGIDLPNSKILNRAGAYNPHGFGFCTNEKLYKTLSFNAFMREARKIGIDDQAIIHFRYATTGSVKRANCHPFEKDNVFFAHNGVLNIETKNDMTDSETFFIKVVLPVIDEYGFNSRTFKKIMYKYAGFSRFAIMKDDTIRLFGNFVEYEGCYYSNTKFLDYYSPY